MAGIPDEISPALVAALGELDELARDKTAKVPMKTGGSYTYKYTDLGSVLGYVRPVLAKHDLAVMQPVTSENRAVSVQTIILHKSGQCREFPPLVMPAGGTPQEVGSAITYARRYSLLAALGLATEDDDGKAATEAVQRADDVPDTPPVMSPANVTRFMDTARESGATIDDLEAMVRQATNDRTVIAALVYATEVPALRAAYAAWLEARPADDDDPLDRPLPEGNVIVDSNGDPVDDEAPT